MTLSIIDKGIVATRARQMNLFKKNIKDVFMPQNQNLTKESQLLLQLTKLKRDTKNA